MGVAGRAWRGWFPPGGELTSGVPDGKEGIYFGREDGPEHPRVRAGTSLHGQNLFPVDSDLGPAVLAVLDALTDRIHHPTRGTLLTPSTRAPGAPKQPPNILKVPPRTNHRAAVHTTATVASSIRAAEAVVVRDVGLAGAVHVHVLLVLVLVVE